MAFKHAKKRILVIKNRAIGDTVLLTGSLRLLRERFPKHQIHVLVRSPAGELLEGLPFVDRVISILEPRNKIDRFAYWMRLVRRLRHRKYELILNFHASFRTALTAKFLRGKTHLANHHELKGRNWFSDRPVPGRGVVKSIIDRDLDLLRAVGIEASVEQAAPELKLLPIELDEARKWFGAERPKLRVFLGIGASRATKRWTMDGYVALAKRLVQNFDAELVVCPAPNFEERRWFEEFFEKLSRDPTVVANLRVFEKTRIRSVAQLVALCELYIGNDSGVKHVAAALGLPTFTFFGPEAPLEWQPYSKEHHRFAFIEKMPCRQTSKRHWCSISECIIHKHRCMTEITVDEIWPELVSLLESKKGFIGNAP